VASGPSDAARTAAAGEARDLVVTFAGPFCFWQEDGKIKVMSPPVGPTYSKYPHQPWFGTSTNEIAVNVPLATDFHLDLGEYKSPPAPQRTGTPIFLYEQGQGTGAKPLFNLYVPVPNVIIGLRPTVVRMVCAQATPDPLCHKFTVLASGTSFVYQRVYPEQIKIKKDPSGNEFFKPCFTNDESLQANALGIHLTPLDRRPDPGHRHAKEVWGQMLDMYPWIKKEITNIDFCPTFDPAACVFDPERCELPSKTPQHPLVGPGGDCQVPIMDLGAGPSHRLHKA
jgi:hypothetical protein